MQTSIDRLLEKFDIGVAGAANEYSPLVKQKNGASVGFGVSYTWLRSEEKARP
jgi:MipA family protein